MESRILRCRSLVQLTELSKASIYRLVRAGEFPAPIKLGARAVGWRRDEIEDWIAGRERAGSLTAAPKAEGDESKERE